MSKEKDQQDGAAATAELPRSRDAVVVAWAYNKTLTDEEEGRLRYDYEVDNPDDLRTHYSKTCGEPANTRRIHGPSGGFTEVVHPETIREVLDLFVKHPEDQRAPFVAALVLKPKAEWGTLDPHGGPRIIEGARIASASEMPENMAEGTGPMVRRYHVSDPCGYLRLDQVQAVQLFNG